MWLVSGVFSCAIILLHVATPSSSRGVSERLAGPTMHQPRSVWTAYGSSLLPAITSFGLIAFRQLDPISIPTSRLSSSGGILFLIFSRCCHLSATAGVGIWSFLDGIMSLAYALWSSTCAHLSGAPPLIRQFWIQGLLCGRALCLN